MPCFFSVRDIQFDELTGGYDVIVTTGTPVHLFMRWSLVQPQRHIEPRFRRGLWIHTDVYLCFVAYHDNEQVEAGDTITHTFAKHNWPCCERRYFHFWGTHAGEVCRSTTALFNLHSRAPAIFTTEALGYSGCVYANESSYAAARDKWRGTVAVDTNLCTAGQAKEGTWGFYIWRAGLFFPPTGIPKGGTILEAKIRLDVIHGGIFSAINDADQCLTLVHFPWIPGPPIKPHHYGYIGRLVQDHGHICRDDWLAAAPGIAEIQLNHWGISEIQKDRITRFAMRGSHDINNIPDVGFIERNRYDWWSPNLSQTGGLWLVVKWRC